MRHCITITAVFLLGMMALDGRPAQAAVYGEWLIRPRPDKGPQYNQLIEQKGLPLFKAAGGRMVGWWNTLVGNQYEHLTIWEYDDMAAYEKAIGFLGKNKEFAEFVALRDPLLAGEDSRFLGLAPFAEKPALGEPAPFVVHEIQRVPLSRMGDYMKFMQETGLPLLKKHGFRPVGPLTVNVGSSTEVTYLLRFKSLEEREQLIAKFAAHADGAAYGKIQALVSGVTTRMLMPAAFSLPAPANAPQPAGSALLPHLEQLAPGVFAAGFAAKYASANCGWVALQDETLLVDVPRGVDVVEFMAEVAKLSGKPVRQLVLTHFEPNDARIVEALQERGISKIIASPQTREALLKASSKIAPKAVTELAKKQSLESVSEAMEFIPLDGVNTAAGAALYLPRQQVLFAGPLVINGPRSKLAGSDTAKWLAEVGRLEKLGAGKVVPAFGTWGGANLVTRQRQFLAEMRQQVAYFICQGRPHEALQSDIRMPAAFLAWMPGDTPKADDIEHIYRELTVPFAPFNGQPPQTSDKRPHALVLIGDLFHEPAHFEVGLRPVFEAAGVVPHFTVDVTALTAENLAKVQLLVILRDGMQHPRNAPNYMWMKPEQEKAVVDFVEGGKGFLNLHNSMGLYPNGPYLTLSGGRFANHGPIERFRVEVVDKEHPITRGVSAFSIADEQHWPAITGKVHLLLQSRSDEGRIGNAGWVLEPGKGRVCHLAPGHNRESLVEPMYQLLMRNAVNWCLRRDP